MNTKLVSKDEKNIIFTSEISKEAFETLIKFITRENQDLTFLDLEKVKLQEKLLN